MHKASSKYLQRMTSESALRHRLRNAVRPLSNRIIEVHSVHGLLLLGFNVPMARGYIQATSNIARARRNYRGGIRLKLITLLS